MKNKDGKQIIGVAPDSIKAPKVDKLSVVVIESGETKKKMPMLVCKCGNFLPHMFEVFRGTQLIAKEDRPWQYKHAYAEFVRCKVCSESAIREDIDKEFEDVQNKALETHLKKLNKKKDENN